MDERYIKNIGALTQADCELLRGSSVFVAGCGGLGGYIIDMLLRIGVGSISTADGDAFERSNLNRQLLSRPDLIGESKAAAARDYAARVNPGVRFTAHGEFITEGNVAAMIAGCGAVLDALDSVPARRLLKSECDRQGIPYVHGAINGWTAEAAVSLPGDGLLERLYPGEIPAMNQSSLAFTPAACAAIQCALCVRLLCSKPIERGRLYYLDLSDMEFESLQMS